MDLGVKARLGMKVARFGGSWRAVWREEVVFARSGNIQGRAAAESLLGLTLGPNKSTSKKGHQRIACSMGFDPHAVLVAH